jgi:flagellar basal body-associated protein FliL
MYTYHVTAGKIGQSCAILGGVLALMVRVAICIIYATMCDTQQDEKEEKEEKEEQEEEEEEEPFNHQAVE